MNNAKSLLLMVTLWLASMPALAQYDVSFIHYFDMQPSFNPAAVGKQDKLNLTAALAMDMVGFTHNPQAMMAAADMPMAFLGQRHGAGIQLLSDKIGLFTHQRVSAQYAFRHRLLGGMVAVGVQGGVLSERFDGTRLDTNDPYDPAFDKTVATGTGFDLGLGLLYERGEKYVGFSVLHLNAPVIQLDATHQLAVEPIYYLTAGGNIHLRNPFLSIKPSMLLMADGIGLRADFTGRLVYTHGTKMLYGGLGYSPVTSVAFLIGGGIKGVIVGYSYEAYTSGDGPGSGSHELFVGYQMNIDLKKRGRNLHKSVRLL